MVFAVKSISEGRSVNATVRGSIGSSGVCSFNPAPFRLVWWGQAGAGRASWRSADKPAAAGLGTAGGGGSKTRGAVDPGGDKRLTWRGTTKA